MSQIPYAMTVHAYGFKQQGVGGRVSVAGVLVTGVLVANI